MYKKVETSLSLTSRLELESAATKQLLDFLRFHILSRPSVCPARLRWYHRSCTFLLYVLFRFDFRAGGITVPILSEDSREERHIVWSNDKMEVSEGGLKAFGDGQRDKFPVKPGPISAQSGSDK